MALPALTRAIAEALGFSDFEPAPDGSFHIDIEDFGVVEFSPNPVNSGFVVSASIGGIPMDGREKMFAELLEANLEGAGTGGAFLSIDTVLNEIVLCRCFPYDTISIDAFEPILIDFLETFRLWHQRHRDGKIGTGAPLDADAPTHADEPAPGPAPGPDMVRI